MEIWPRLKYVCWHAEWARLQMGPRLPYEVTASPIDFLVVSGKYEFAELHD